MTVSVEALGKEFGSFRAVDRVSFDLQRGEFLSLLGPSGCGKTTTLRMVAGFERPSDGRILLSGRDVTRLPARRRNIGMVFQNYALFPHMTVSRNVAFGLETRHVGRADRDRRVAAALDIVRMTDHADKHPRQLSGGQQQRVALARALVIEPDLLLLDEPLSALDLKLREEMRDEIFRITRELGITTIFVTHDQGEALVLSNRVAVMNRGRVEQLDSPEVLYRRPRTAFVADFIGGANVLSGRLIRNGAEGALEIGALRLPLGALPCGVAAGAITLSVRPEHVLLSRCADGAGFAVVRRRFLGSVVEYAVKAGNLELTVREHGDHHLSEGEQVSVTFPPERLIFLTNDGK
ncbi:MAG: ABC transporter ATP-binding protein [Pararhizobium sp.]